MKNISETEFVVQRASLVKRLETVSKNLEVNVYSLAKSDMQQKNLLAAMIRCMAKDDPLCALATYGMQKCSITIDIRELAAKEYQSAAWHETLKRMETEGGSFVQALARAWRHADPFNDAIFREVYFNYWNSYSEKVNADA